MTLGKCSRSEVPISSPKSGSSSPGFRRHHNCFNVFKCSIGVSSCSDSALFSTFRTSRNRRPINSDARLACESPSNPDDAAAGDNGLLIGPNVRRAQFCKLSSRSCGTASENPAGITVNSGFPDRSNRSKQVGLPNTGALVKLLLDRISSRSQEYDNDGASMEEIFRKFWLRSSLVTRRRMSSVNSKARRPLSASTNYFREKTNNHLSDGQCVR